MRKTGGATWKYIRQSFPSIELYQSDESHPSVAGTFAGACTFYSSIFKKNPAAITYNAGLAVNVADSIRKAAKRIVYDSLASWHFPDEAPAAEFRYTVSNPNNEVHFINASRRADAYFWNFGDGDTSSQVNPTHTFSGNGSYLVSLTVSRCDLGVQLEHTFRKTIIFCPHTPTIFPDTIMLCTVNPDSLRTQTFDAYQWFGPAGDSIPNATSQIYTPVQSGLHSVRTTLNGCSEMSSPAFVDAVSAFNFYYIEPVEHDTLCEGDTTLLILKPLTSPKPADRDVEWFLDGSPIPFSANDTLKAASSGQYYAVIYDSLYCPGSPMFTTSSLPLFFSPCTGTKSEKQASLTATVYPNPGKIFSVSFHTEVKGVPYTVCDVVGKCVSRGIFLQPQNVLNLNELEIGVYFLTLGTNQKQVLRLIRE